MYNMLRKQVGFVDKGFFYLTKEKAIDETKQPFILANKIYHQYIYIYIYNYVRLKNCPSTAPCHRSG